MKKILFSLLVIFSSQLLAEELPPQFKVEVVSAKREVRFVSGVALQHSLPVSQHSVMTFACRTKLSIGGSYLSQYSLTDGFLISITPTNLQGKNISALVLIEVSTHQAEGKSVYEDCLIPLGTAHKQLVSKAVVFKEGEPLDFALQDGEKFTITLSPQPYGF